MLSEEAGWYENREPIIIFDKLLLRAGETSRRGPAADEGYEHRQGGQLSLPISARQGATADSRGETADAGPSVLASSKYSSQGAIWKNLLESNY